MNYDKAFAERMKRNYPPGTRIELISMDDPYAPIPPGTRGEVMVVDDMGTLHMKWDNGRSLGVVPGEDNFRKLTQEEIFQEQLPKMFERYTTTVDAQIFPKIDFDRLGKEYAANESTYIKEILKELHEAFIDIYGTDTATADFGYIEVPGIVESGMTGEIYPALLAIDCESSGEHWQTCLITPDGIIEQNNEDNTEEQKEFLQTLFPYRYWFTINFFDDIHVNWEDCPNDVKDILESCNEHLFDNLTGGMTLC